MHIKNHIFIIASGVLILSCIGVALIVKKDMTQKMVSHVLVTADQKTIEVREFPVRSADRIVVMLPNASESQGDNVDIAQTFQRNGFAVITMDWRGQSDQSNKTYSSSEWMSTSADVDVVVQYARDQYPKSTLILAGGGFGANQAVVYATEHAGIDAVFALSPRASIRGVSVVEAIRAYTGTLVVMEYRSSDPNDATEYPADQLIDKVSAKSVLYLSTPEKKSGWEMLRGQESAIMEIIAWIKTYL